MWVQLKRTHTHTHTHTHTLIVGTASYSSLDCTQICLQRWDVIDPRLNLSRIFSVFPFLSQPLSSLSSTWRHFLFAAIVFISAPCGLRVLDVCNLQEEVHSQDVDIKVCLYGFWLDLEPLHCTHPHITLRCFMCWAVVLFEHKQAKWKAAAEFGLKQKLAEHHSEMPVGLCCCSGFLLTS